MMTGTITNFRPQIRLYVKGVGVNGVFEFTIDTGYQGTLTLSEADCLALKLPWVKKATFQLADGKPIKCNRVLAQLSADRFHANIGTFSTVSLWCLRGLFSPLALLS